MSERARASKTSEGSDERIRIELRFDGGVPTGCAAGTAGSGEFTGWVALMSLVDELVSRRQPDRHVDARGRRAG